MVAHSIKVVYSCGMATKQELLDTIAKLATDTEARNAEYLDTKMMRDNLIREAISDGVTMYAIAKRIGISQTAVANIRDGK